MQRQMMKIQECKTPACSACRDLRYPKNVCVHYERAIRRLKPLRQTAEAALATAAGERTVIVHQHRIHPARKSLCSRSSCAYVQRYSVVAASGGDPFFGKISALLHIGSEKLHPPRLIIRLPPHVCKEIKEMNTTAASKHRCVLARRIHRPSLAEYF